MTSVTQQPAFISGLQLTRHFIHRESVLSHHLHRSYTMPLLTLLVDYRDITLVQSPATALRYSPFALTDSPAHTLHPPSSFLSSHPSSAVSSPYHAAISSSITPLYSAVPCTTDHPTVRTALQRTPILWPQTGRRSRLQARTTQTHRYPAHQQRSHSAS